MVWGRSGSLSGTGGKRGAPEGREDDDGEEDDGDQDDDDDDVDVDGCGEMNWGDWAAW